MLKILAHIYLCIAVHSRDTKLFQPACTSWMQGRGTAWLGLRGQTFQTKAAPKRTCSRHKTCKRDTRLSRDHKPGTMLHRAMLVGVGSIILSRNHFWNATRMLGTLQVQSFLRHVCTSVCVVTWMTCARTDPSSSLAGAWVHQYTSRLPPKETKSFNLHTRTKLGSELG